VSGLPAALSRLPDGVQSEVRRAYRRAWAAVDPHLSDGVSLRLRSTAQFGRPPRLSPPRTFNEKVLWRRLYDRRPLFRELCDKLAVRDHVAERVGAGVLVDLYGVYDQGAAVPWHELPGSCVIKASHGSGWVKVVDDPARVDPARVAPILDGWLATDYAEVWRERHYSGVPRRIMVERRLGDGDLLDLKLLCFDGTPQLVLVGHGLASETPRTAFYLPAWERLPMTWGREPGLGVERPAQLGDALEIAAELSRGIDFVRVDLYLSGEGVHFGELTFTPMGGTTPMAPRRYDEWLGSLWTLPGAAEA
jgi:hypothetical protein